MQLKSNQILQNAGNGTGRQADDGKLGQGKPQVSATSSAAVKSGVAMESTITTQQLYEHLQGMPTAAAPDKMSLIEENPGRQRSSAKDSMDLEYSRDGTITGIRDSALNPNAKRTNGSVLMPNKSPKFENTMRTEVSVRYGADDLDSFDEINARESEGDRRPARSGQSKNAMDASRAEDMVDATVIKTKIKFDQTLQLIDGSSREDLSSSNINDRAFTSELFSKAGATRKSRQQELIQKQDPRIEEVQSASDTEPLTFSLTYGTQMAEMVNQEGSSGLPQEAKNPAMQKATSDNEQLLRNRLGKNAAKAGLKQAKRQRNKQNLPELAEDQFEDQLILDQHVPVQANQTFKTRKSLKFQGISKKAQSPANQLDGSFKTQKTTIVGAPGKISYQQQKLQKQQTLGSVYSPKMTKQKIRRTKNDPYDTIQSKSITSTQPMAMSFKNQGKINVGQQEVDMLPPGSEPSPRSPISKGSPREQEVDKPEKLESQESGRDRRGGIDHNVVMVQRVSPRPVPAQTKLVQPRQTYDVAAAIEAAKAAAAKGEAAAAVAGVNCWMDGAGAIEAAKAAAAKGAAAAQLAGENGWRQSVDASGQKDGKNHLAKPLVEEKLQEDFEREVQLDASLTGVINLMNNNNEKEDLNNSISIFQTPEQVTQKFQAQSLKSQDRHESQKGAKLQSPKGIENEAVEELSLGGGDADGGAGGMVHQREGSIEQSGEIVDNIELMMENQSKKKPGVSAHIQALLDGDSDDSPFAVTSVKQQIVKADPSPRGPPKVKGQNAPAGSGTNPLSDHVRRHIFGLDDNSGSNTLDDFKGPEADNNLQLPSGRLSPAFEEAEEHENSPSFKGKRQSQEEGLKLSPAFQARDNYQEVYAAFQKRCGPEPQEDEALAARASPKVTGFKDQKYEVTSNDASQDMGKLEQTIIKLNKDAMEQLAREEYHGYGVIDQTQWASEMQEDKGFQLHKRRNTVQSPRDAWGSQAPGMEQQRLASRSPNGTRKQKQTIPDIDLFSNDGAKIPMSETSTPQVSSPMGDWTGQVSARFQTSKKEDVLYYSKKNNYLKERFVKDNSTKVKVVKPTKLKSFQLLKEAEALLLKSDQGKGTLDQVTRYQLSCLTLNNLGCLYKKLNWDKVALEYFQQVLQLEKILKVDTMSLVTTMLNICAHLSKQGKHTEALLYAKRSITYLKREIMDEKRKEATKQELSSPKSDQGAKTRADVKSWKKAVPSMDPTIWATLQIAFYNMAVELEHLNQFKEAITTFNLAKGITGKHLNQENVDMIAIIDQNIPEIQLKLSNMELKGQKRAEKREKNHNAIPMSPKDRSNYYNQKELIDQSIHSHENKLTRLRNKRRSQVRDQIMQSQLDESARLGFSVKQDLEDMNHSMMAPMSNRQRQLGIMSGSINSKAFTNGNVTARKVSNSNRAKSNPRALTGGIHKLGDKLISQFRPNRQKSKNKDRSAKRNTITEHTLFTKGGNYQDQDLHDYFSKVQHQKMVNDNKILRTLGGQRPQILKSKPLPFKIDQKSVLISPQSYDYGNNLSRGTGQIADGEPRNSPSFGCLAKLEAPELMMESKLHEKKPQTQGKRFRLASINVKEDGEMNKVSPRAVSNQRARGHKEDLVLSKSLLSQRHPSTTRGQIQLIHGTTPTNKDYEFSQRHPQTTKKVQILHNYKKVNLPSKLTKLQKPPLLLPIGNSEQKKKTITPNTKTMNMTWQHWEQSMKSVHSESKQSARQQQDKLYICKSFL